MQFVYLQFDSCMTRMKTTHLLRTELGMIIIIIIIHPESQKQPKIWTQLKPRVVPMSRDRSAANYMKAAVF